MNYKELKRTGVDISSICIVWKTHNFKDGRYWVPVSRDQKSKFFKYRYISLAMKFNAGYLKKTYVWQ